MLQALHAAKVDRWGGSFQFLKKHALIKFLTFSTSNTGRKLTILTYINAGRFLCDYLRRQILKKRNERSTQNLKIKAPNKWMPLYLTIKPVLACDF